VLPDEKCCCGVKAHHSSVLKAALIQLMKRQGGMQTAPMDQTQNLH
jgi:hypothetical protein